MLVLFTNGKSHCNITRPSQQQRSSCF